MAAAPNSHRRLVSRIDSPIPLCVYAALCAVRYIWIMARRVCRCGEGCELLPRVSVRCYMQRIILLQRPLAARACIIINVHSAAATLHYPSLSDAVPSSELCVRCEYRYTPTRQFLFHAITAFAISACIECHTDPLFFSSSSRQADVSSRSLPSCVPGDASALREIRFVLRVCVCCPVILAFAGWYGRRKRAEKAEIEEIGTM